MSHYTYLIVGGGMTGAAAVNGIREVDVNGSIGLFSIEPDPPYDRPPLSKGLWKGTALESIWRQLENQGVELRLGCGVRRVDSHLKQVSDDRGTFHTFDKLRLATGGMPRQLPFRSDQIILFSDSGRLPTPARTCGTTPAFLCHRWRLHWLGSCRCFGDEPKADRDDHSGTNYRQRVFPHDLGLYLNGYCRQKFQLLTEAVVVDVETRGDCLAVKARNLKTGQDREVIVDGVVAGIGIEPKVELARAAGLKVDNGILVDELLRTSHPDI